jgi:hypothetical protein
MKQPHDKAMLILAEEIDKVCIELQEREAPDLIFPPDIAINSQDPDPQLEAQS